MNSPCCHPERRASTGAAGERKSKDPEDVSSAMRPQGILLKIFSSSQLNMALTWVQFRLSGNYSADYSVGLPRERTRNDTVWRAPRADKIPVCSRRSAALFPCPGTAMGLERLKSSNTGAVASPNLQRST